MIVSKESYNIREIIAVLARRYDEHQTMGSLSIFQADRCILTVKTLELPWKNNERKISCIPNRD